MKIRNYLKNMMFLMELEIKLKKQIEKNVIMKKIIQKLNLILMMTYH